MLNKIIMSDDAPPFMLIDTDGELIYYTTSGVKWIVCGFADAENAKHEPVVVVISKRYKI